MRKPKDADRYVSRDEGAQFLIGLAFKLLDRSHSERVKIRIQASYWNDDWLDKKKAQPAFIATQANQSIGGK